MNSLLKKVFAGVLAMGLVYAELPAEKIPNVAVLPADYPESWIFAHDANFDALIAGRVVILDVATDTSAVQSVCQCQQHHRRGIPGSDL